MKATWNGVVLAESGQTRMIDGNHYFPPESLRREHFAESETHTVCAWKGEASYFHVRVRGETNRDAAWTYADPLPAVQDIKGYVAFWHGVRVSA
jgi:uncharacterized protein (DUF427 family)